MTPLFALSGLKFENMTYSEIWIALDGCAVLQTTGSVKANTESLVSIYRKIYPEATAARHALF